MGSLSLKVIVLIGVIAANCPSMAARDAPYYSKKATCARLIAVFRRGLDECNQWGSHTGIPKSRLQAIVGTGTTTHRFRTVRDFVVNLLPDPEGAEASAFLKTAVLTDLLDEIYGFEYYFHRLKDGSVSFESPYEVHIVIRKADARMFQGIMPITQTIEDLIPSTLESMANFDALVPRY